jgi:hypothetical protein
MTSAGQRWPAADWLASVRLLTPVTFWPGFGAWPGKLIWPGMASRSLLAIVLFSLQVSYYWHPIQPCHGQSKKCLYF